MPLTPSHLTDQQLQEAAKHHKTSPLFDVFFLGFLKNSQSAMNQRGQLPIVGEQYCRNEHLRKEIIARILFSKNDDYKYI
jgi:hypothetical protein